MTTPPNLDDDEPQDSKSRSEGSKSLLPEGLRRAIQSGANVLFASEDGTKKSLGELRLPKDAMQFLMLQAERGRKDLFRGARQEMRRMLQSMDLRGELRRALVGLKVQVKAEITFTEDGPQLHAAKSTVDVVGGGEAKAARDTPSERRRRKSKAPSEPL